MINRKNLQKLATLLAYGDLPREVAFGMADYCSAGTIFITEPPCGSSACAIGFAPFAGIRKKSGESFNEYCWRALGVDAGDDSREFQWCFSSDWTSADNTPTGAAKRIQYLLDNSLEEWNGSIGEGALKLYVHTKVKNNVPEKEK